MPPLFGRWSIFVILVNGNLPLSLEEGNRVTNFKLTTRFESFIEPGIGLFKAVGSSSDFFFASLMGV
jgi:hypothetical protein